ncbi:two-component system, NtrC family, response regulator AtoC [Methylomagnum ishizawai]|uniref:Two-component system, NtrC family, response regulator AtoC n=1 Tax=Methylomagnum ishizawai TaxID=1760988 RepID=A0A1Y6D325_9GAMM|nr:sigma-54 dependent transcriptional regulator [Methylomagnum ishizawai]SMF97057.1 two-component system, NtrC family, response regulator AtoC [Methylomagnum ishizawai]
MDADKDRGFAILGNLDTALTEALGERLLEMDLEIRPVRHATEFHSLATQPGGRIAVLGGGHGSDPDALDWLDGRVDARLPLVLVDASDSKERAVRALRLGFKDYLAWPSPIAPLCAAVIDHIEQGHAPIRMLPRDMPSILTSNPDMLARAEYARRIAGHDCHTFITGEPGTGKELFAELIHGASQRRAGPLIRFNGTTLPGHLLEGELFGYERGAFEGAIRPFPGRLALADGGTLFLEEPGELPAAIQAELVRVLEIHAVIPLGGDRPRRVDLRVIAASRQPLDTLARSGKLHPGLLSRLNAATIELPPLRERTEDIPLLFRHFLHLHATEWRHAAPGVDPSVLEALMAYDWPDNVRELREAVAVALQTCQGPRLLPQHLPKTLRQSAPQSTGERARLLAALAAAGGNKSEAAARLNCSRMTLYRRMRKLGVDLRSHPGPKA